MEVSREELAAELKIMQTIPRRNWFTADMSTRQEMVRTLIAAFLDDRGYVDCEGVGPK